MAMFIITLTIAIFSILGLLAINSSLRNWLCFFAMSTFALQLTKILPNGLIWLFWLLIVAGLVFSIEKIRQKWLSTKLLLLITKKITKFNAVLATDSVKTEPTSKFITDLFKGSLDVNTLLNSFNHELNDKEKQFLNNQVEELCKILNDWKISQDKLRLPTNVWEYLKIHRFFCMRLPASMGGLGFSLHAVIEIIQKIATHNITTAVMIMVPNAIDLPELLLNYGTKPQLDSYLPKLVNGEYIPALVLTANNANNKGVVCYQQYKDQSTLGVLLTWEHDCVALAPIANLLVLSINLYDPHDFLCLNRKNLGNNFCLVPTNLPNVFNSIKRINNQDFLNGPTKGKEVFIPLDFVLGSKELFGYNSAVIINNLLVNKDITCLALSGAISKLCFKNISMHVVANNMHHVHNSAKLAEIGGYNYMLVAARDLLLALTKYNNSSHIFVTMIKQYINDISKNIFNNTIDIYKGNITLGIKNYLALSYQKVFAAKEDGLDQVSLLKTIIKFHPFLQVELDAIRGQDVGLFDHYLFNHISHNLSNLAKLVLHVCSNKIFLGKLNINNNIFQRYYRDTKLFSILFVCLLEMSLLYINKFDDLSLKEQRLLTRLLDVLRTLFMICAIIKYYNKHQLEPTEEHFAIWSMQVSLYNLQQAVIEFLQNFPNKLLAKLINILLFPFGKKYYMPNDELDLFISNTVTKNSNIRDRLLFGCYLGAADAK